MEKDIDNLPIIFAEMFKDEVNANDEVKMYNGFKRVIKKYASEKGAISAIDEFTRVICGGASLEEIMQVAKDEGIHPTIISEMIVDNSGND